MVATQQRQLQLLRLLRLARDQIENQQHHQRARERRAQDGEKRGAAIAKSIGQLLADDGEDLGKHRISPRFVWERRPRRELQRIFSRRGRCSHTGAFLIHALHASNPSSVPSNFTNASSSDVCPLTRSISSGVPSATMRPCPMITIRSHSAATSCMMWLEKSTHFPAARKPRISSRIARVAITSRPLVGS